MFSWKPRITSALCLAAVVAVGPEASARGGAALQPKGARR
jgi:hypothetical protein